ncbi:MAG: DUF6138 family protein [Capnocytophaga sp.]|nr:DUF6138 family protein [Capnocytophaga sp.]
MEITKYIITQLTDNAKLLLDKELERVKDDKPFADLSIQEGYHDILQIKISDTNVGYALNDFDWGSFDHQFSLPELEKISAEAFTPIAEEVAQNLEAYFHDKAETMLFAYQFKVQFSFRTYKKTFVFENETKKQALKTAMDSYIQEVFFDQKRKIESNREISILCKRLVNFSLMQYTEKEFISLVEKLFNYFEKPENRKFKPEFRSILFNLHKWREQVFFPIYYDIEQEFMRFEMTPKPEFALHSPKSAPKLDPEKIRTEDLPKVELFVRQAVWNIKMREPYNKGKNDLELAASEFGSAEAKMYLEEGSGVLDKSLIYLKDKDLEAKANDVFATISLSLKTENAESYRKALDFVINLLKGGFPKSYSIEFSSKGKKIFLPIKGLAKSPTHRFFAQTLSFPELYDKLQEYAQTAMAEFEWYGDVESEKSCMPSSYAVFGLGLTAEKYFPLVEKYLETVDDEHQSVHFEFLEAFAEKWGISEKSLPIIIKGAFSGQFHKPMKSIKNQLTEDNKSLIINAINEYKDPYDKETLNFVLLGKRGK